MNPNVRPYWFAPVIAAVVVLLGVTGCPQKPATVATGNGNRTAENPWPKADSQLRKDASLASCRGVLSQLNSDLALNSDAPFQPAGLAPDAEPALQNAVNLSEAEVKELRPTSFSNLDPHYLAECFYFRDVAQSLGLTGLPPAKQAELAFAWVCRQLVLNHWATPTSATTVQPMPPVPPVFVLRRGSGSGLERGLVFLALLQQLGLDGCLVGPPEAATRGWSYSTDNTKAPKGPFWAVGARVGGDVLLFDPWRGEALPGTLAQLKTNPDVLKPWFEDKARPWDVTPDLVKSATPFLTAPLSGLAPRMQRLEKELQTTGAPRLAVDAVALQARFAKETKLADVKFWNPPNEAYTPTRLLDAFLPPAEGGTAKDERLYVLYQQSAIPADLLTMFRIEQAQDPGQMRFFVPERLRGTFAALLPKNPGDTGVPEAIKRVADLSIGAFAQAFLVSPTPRERIQRGQFAEVLPFLGDNKRRFDNARERLRNDGNVKEALQKWGERGREVYLKLSTARAGGNPADIAAAAADAEAFWRGEQGVAGALVDAVIAETGAAESRFLFALCMHEQAERSQTRYERLAADPAQAAAAAEAKQRAHEDWAEAKGWWEQYKPFAAGQNEAFPGRAVHTERLRERAASQFTKTGGR